MALIEIKLRAISCKLAQDLITHQQLKFTINNTSILSGSHSEKVIIVFPPSMEAAGVNRPQQFVVLIKLLTFSENLTG